MIKNFLVLYAPENISIFATPELLNIKISADVEKNCVEFASPNDLHLDKREWGILKLITKEECVVLESVALELLFDNDFDSYTVKPEVLEVFLTTLFETSEVIPVKEGRILHFNNSTHAASQVLENTDSLRVKSTFPVSQGLFYKNKTAVKVVFSAK